MSRKAKPFSIYPDDTDRSKLRIIANATDRSAARVALRLVRRGIASWERRQLQQHSHPGVRA